VNVERRQWIDLHVRMPVEALPVFAQAKRATGIHHPDPSIANGLVVEALSADFLAGQQPTIESKGA